MTVAAAPRLAVASTRSAISSGGDQRVVAVQDDHGVGVAHQRRAPRGPRRRCRRAAAARRSRCPRGAPPERSRSGETITQTRSAPASRAASIGQAIIGRPQTGCRTLGTDERIRVPSPAAMIRTVGPLTCGIVEPRRR